MNLDAQRLKVAGLSVILIAPAAIFFLAAIGRSLQPVAHEPAHTLDAIVTWFGALSSLALVVLIVVLPSLALVLAATIAWRTWSADEGTRADVAAFIRAGAKVVRRPAFVIAVVLLAFGIVYFAALGVHAIAG